MTGAMKWIAALAGGVAIAAVAADLEVNRWFMCFTAALWGFFCVAVGEAMK